MQGLKQKRWQLLSPTDAAQPAEFPQQVVCCSWFQHLQSLVALCQKFLWNIINLRFLHCYILHRYYLDLLHFNMALLYQGTISYKSNLIPGIPEYIVTLKHCNVHLKGFILTSDDSIKLSHPFNTLAALFGDYSRKVHCKMCSTVD